MRFVLPLSGALSKVSYQPLFDGGETYQLRQTTTRITLDCQVEKKDHEGFTCTAAIPIFLFGKALPQELGYNIIVKAPTGKGKFATTSMLNTAGYNSYSPLLWPVLSFTAKPYFKARWLLWLTGFCAGIVISLFVHFILQALTKDRPRVLMVRHSEMEKRSFNKAKDEIDCRITGKILNAAAVAAALGITAKQIEKTIRKMTGLSFKDYVMYLRTEIVCERLRSSHSGEATIAESCGFRDAKEMSRYFRRFQHMTPQNFRRMQQVMQGNG